MKYHSSTNMEAARRTDPIWLPWVSSMAPWINKMAGRNDLVVRILPNIGAPARFCMTLPLVDFNVAYMNKVDPSRIGTAAFMLHNPDLAGAGVHEALHARLTPDTRMLLKNYPREYDTMMLLEEGRIETIGYQGNFLTASERLAMQAMILEIVIKDFIAGMEQGETEQPYDKMVRLAGLVLARREAGLVPNNSKTAKMFDLIADTLGEELTETLRKIAVAYANTHDVPTMVVLARQWLDATQENKPGDEGEGEDGGEQGEQDDSSEGQEGDGQEGDSNQGEGEDSDEDGDGSEGGGDSDEDGDKEDSDSGGSGSGDDSEDATDEGDDSGAGDDSGDNEEPADGKEDSGEAGGEGDDSDDSEGTGPDGGQSSRHETQEAGQGQYDSAQSAFDEALSEILNEISEAQQDVRTEIREQQVFEVRAEARASAQTKAKWQAVGQDMMRRARRR